MREPNATVPCPSDRCGRVRVTMCVQPATGEGTSTSTGGTGTDGGLREGGGGDGIGKEVGGCGVVGWSD
jgi:hypothetical protein